MLPFKNCELSLRTGKFSPIVQEDYLTVSLDYEYK